MNELSAEFLLMIFCGIVVVSYLFSILTKFIRVPSVLLLLFAGVGIRLLTDNYGITFEFPPKLVESLGVVGLIMIVLEAGLDLKLARNKLRLIRNSFLSAIIIFILSTALISTIIHSWLNEAWLNCIVYGIPLSIISSAIVIPSLHHLTEQKKEFLIYEASFSDIAGILIFNYITVNAFFSLKSFGLFGGSILIAAVLSLVLSLLLFFIMSKTTLNIKFFLIFSLLILIYASGKILHLPSLIIILVFGLMINNWDKIRWKWMQRKFPQSTIDPIYQLLHSITAETSFLIRTFFFILFGYTIRIESILQEEVIAVGILIVLALFVVRYFYLSFFLRTNVFPELFFMPRGLITIVLFYKIPDTMKLHSFEDGILFFVILTTSLLMAIGMLFYKKRPEQIVEEHQFSERSDIL